MKRALALAALCALALAGCATARAPTPMCLPLKPYTAAEQSAIGEALAALPAGSPLDGVMADYLAMRDADRACLSIKP